jgi:hypothetical protein
LLIEPLEDRRLLALTLEEQILYGGANDQRGTAITLDGNSLYLAGRANENQGFALKYATPLTAGATPSNTNFLSTTTALSGITASGSHVVAVGDVIPPTYGSVDGSGGAEQKPLLARFDNLLNLNGAQSINLFPYEGGESFRDDLLVNEGGTDYVYVSGSAQANGGNNTAVLLKYDTGGVPQWRRDLGSTAYFNNSDGTSIAVAGGDIFVAGTTHYGYDTPGNLMAALWKVDSSGSPASGFPKQEFQGRFHGLTSFDGALYAVGTAYETPNIDGTQQYLIVKYDTAGTVLWSKILGASGNADELNAIVGMESMFVTPWIACRSTPAARMPSCCKSIPRRAPSFPRRCGAVPAMTWLMVLPPTAADCTWWGNPIAHPPRGKMSSCFNTRSRSSRCWERLTLIRKEGLATKLRSTPTANCCTSPRAWAKGV